MGSVPHLYTTGDNDPEIEPVQYYRHYLYCDECGSFELGSWTRRRRGLAGLLGLGSREHVGLCCRQCDTRYAYGTPFFTDLDANPRELTLEDVPRPLGVSHFEQGKYVGPAPAERRGVLPP